MIIQGILLGIWSKILKSLVFTPSNMNVALHAILILCLFETSLNFIYYQMKNSVPSFSGNKLLTFIIIFEFFRSALSRGFLFLMACNYQSLSKTTKRYAFKLGTYFAFYAVFYILWVKLDSYKHEIEIPDWIISSSLIVITLLDGIMMKWIYNGFERSIRYLD
jgi:hypothetical protein